MGETHTHKFRQFSCDDKRGGSAGRRRVREVGGWRWGGEAFWNEAIGWVAMGIWGAKHKKKAINT